MAAWTSICCIKINGSLRRFIINISTVLSNRSNFSLQNAKRIRPDQTIEAVQGPEGSAGAGGGGDVQAAGRQASLGLPQGKQAPRSSKQTVVHSRQQNGTHLWKGKAESFWNGQAPQGASGIV